MSATPDMFMELIQETYLEYTKDLETHLFFFLFILDQIICVAGLLSSRSELKITSMYVCMYGKCLQGCSKTALLSIL